VVLEGSKLSAWPGFVEICGSLDRVEACGVCNVGL